MLVGVGHVCSILPLYSPSYKKMERNPHFNSLSTPQKHSPFSSFMKEKSGGGGCYFHPKVVVVGVCSLCLHERLLLVLASSSKQRHQYSPSTKSIINIFAFPSLFLNPLHFFNHSNSNIDLDDDDYDTFTSQEDSFISMKIEGNGDGSWEDKNIMNVPKKLKEEEKSVVGHAKVSRSSLRWRKRIGQAFQLIRWKRSNKANVWHVGTKVEGVKVMRKHKQGWIATLTKKKTK